MTRCRRGDHQPFYLQIAIFHTRPLPPAWLETRRQHIFSIYAWVAFQQDEEFRRSALQHPKPASQTSIAMARSFSVFLVFFVSQAVSQACKPDACKINQGGDTCCAGANDVDKPNDYYCDSGTVEYVGDGCDNFIWDRGRTYKCCDQSGAIIGIAVGGSVGGLCFCCGTAALIYCLIKKRVKAETAKSLTTSSANTQPQVADHVATAP